MRGLIVALLSLVVAAWLVGARPHVSTVLPPAIPRPDGFAPDWLARIHRDFTDLARRRLGRALTPAETARAGGAQDAFWAEHAPNVIALQRGEISEEEFATRTRAATRHFAGEMERAFSDRDYQTIFDVEKGTDLFPLLFHSPDEQPGRVAPIAPSLS
jgi:hypothetical protein